MQSFVYLLITECAFVDVCACVYVKLKHDISAYFGFIYSFTLHIAGYLWCGIEIFCVCVCVYSNANVG